jgi:sarcosine oxidase delta subunit
MSEDEDLFGEFRTFVLDQVLHVCASKRDEYVELKQFDKDDLNELRRQFAKVPTKHFAKVPTSHVEQINQDTLIIHYKFPSYTYDYCLLGFYILDNNLLKPDNTIIYDKKIVYCCDLLDQLAELENPDGTNQTIIDYDFSKDDFDDYMYYRENEFGVDEELIKKWENAFRFDHFIKAIKPPLSDLNDCRTFRPETIKLYEKIKRDFGDLRNVIFHMLTLLDYRTLES